MAYGLKACSCHPLTVTIDIPKQPYLLHSTLYNHWSCSRCKLRTCSGQWIFKNKNDIRRAKLISQNWNEFIAVSETIYAIICLFFLQSTSVQLYPRRFWHLLFNRLNPGGWSPQNSLNSFSTSSYLILNVSELLQVHYFRLKLFNKLFN